MSIGQKLKELRKKKKVTQSELADAVGVTRDAYAKHESDGNEPNLDTLDRYASYHGVTVDYIMGRSEQPHRTERDDKFDSLQTMKIIQRTFAKNAVPGISIEQSQKTAETLAMRILEIEEELEKENE